MPHRDVAVALRRLLDSPWACQSLAAGDDYALAGLDLTDDEREMLVREVADVDDAQELVASACVDPTVRDRTGAGAFFDAAEYAMHGLADERHAEEFRRFLRDRQPEG